MNALEHFIDSQIAARIAALDGPSESSHVHADEILCELLKLAGYTQTVEAFRNMEKWYA